MNFNVLQYFEKVTERIKDTGVSVRKRAIKIIRDMCTSNANFSEFTRACIEIISRVGDEESSIQVVKLAFVSRQEWFSSVSNDNKCSKDSLIIEKILFSQKVLEE